MEENRSLLVKLPERGDLCIRNLVLDLNGTLALDGRPLPGVPGLLKKLSEHIDIYLVTSDTFNTAANLGPTLSCDVHRLEAGKSGGPAKVDFVKNLGCNCVVAMGNGRNDCGMLREAALSIAVIGPEGAYPQAVEAADIVVTDPVAGLDLLLHPDRIYATLRP